MIFLNGNTDLRKKLQKNTKRLTKIGKRKRKQQDLKNDNEYKKRVNKILKGK